MTGIIIQLFISWALLYFIEHKNLIVLGLYPSRQRVKEFLSGLLLPIMYWCLLMFGIAAIVHNPYLVNPGYSLLNFLKATAYVFKAVIFEELIFRGAILYILICRIGVTKATFISTAAFGIYHWFSWRLLGQPLPMATAFFTTGILGYLWALMYVKTGSMYLPTALHLGSNFANMIIFSKDKGIGLQLLTKTYLEDPVVPASIIAVPMVLIYHLGFYLLCYALLRFCKPDTKTNRF